MREAITFPESQNSAFQSTAEGDIINDGKYHIYDITNRIRDTAHRINGVERPKPNEGYALQTVSLVYTVPRDGTGVKNNISDSGAENSKNKMRSKSSKQRLAEKVLFDTKVDNVYNDIKSKRFVIIDDTVSTGTTTNALARYLEKAGGQVESTVSLFKGQDHYNDQAITKELLTELERRFGRENVERYISEQGYADKLEQLTRKQAESLLRGDWIDEGRTNRNSKKQYSASQESGSGILSSTSGTTKKISEELEADLDNGPASFMPENDSDSSDNDSGFC